MKGRVEHYASTRVNIFPKRKRVRPKCSKLYLECWRVRVEVLIILNAWFPGPARYRCPRPAGLSRSRALLVSALSARSWCPRPAGLSRSRSLRVPAPSARYGCPRPAGLSRSKSLLVPASRGALEVVVVTGDRGLCSLLAPVARGALEVEIVTGACGLCSLLAPAAKSRRSLVAGRFRGQIRARNVGAT